MRYDVHTVRLQLLAERSVDVLRAALGASLRFGLRLRLLGLVLSLHHCCCLLTVQPNTLPHAGWIAALSRPPSFYLEDNHLHSSALLCVLCLHCIFCATCRLDRCTVTAIPYLEGDYWPGEAENLLAAIADAQRSGNAPGGNTALGRKAGGAKGKRYGSGPQSTDEALLSRLGEILGGNMKEDFMVVHLQEPCSFCRRHVAGGILHK